MAGKIVSLRMVTQSCTSSYPVGEAIMFTYHIYKPRKHTREKPPICNPLSRFCLEGLGQPHSESTCTRKGLRDSSEFSLGSQPILTFHQILGLGQWVMDFF